MLQALNDSSDPSGYLTWVGSVATSKYHPLKLNLSGSEIDQKPYFDPPSVRYGVALHRLTGTSLQPSC